MTQRDIASLAVKIIGIYFIILAVVGLPWIITIPMAIEAAGGVRGGAAVSIASSITWTLLALFLGAALVFRGDKLASRIASDDQTALTRIPATRRELLAIALVIVGITLLAQAVPDTIKLLYDEISTTLVSGQQLRSANIISDGSRLIIGLVLILYAHALAGWIERRHASGQSDAAEM